MRTNTPPNILLIVDGSLDNRYLLTEILVAVGYEVRQVSSGIQAIEAAQSAPPNLILLDIMMPDMSGYDLCQRLKADPQTAIIPVILLSSLADAEIKINTFVAGAVDYITEPFQKAEVLARVSTHLQIQHLSNMLQKQQRTGSVTLAAEIAHELRNPLNFVNNYAEGSIELGNELQDVLAPHLDQLESATAATAWELLRELRENAVAIYEHGQRAQDIIASMTQELGTGGSTTQSFALHTLLDEAIDLAYAGKQLQRPGFITTITKQYDPLIQPWVGSMPELRRAFINLLDNAYDALEEQAQVGGEAYLPELWVQTRQLANQIEIRFRDNGVGIVAGQLDRIFEPFYTTKPPPKGTGLGLALTYEIIVSQHGGQLTVTSEPGILTEVILRLPM